MAEFTAELIEELERISPAAEARAESPDWQQVLRRRDMAGGSRRLVWAGPRTRRARMVVPIAIVVASCVVAAAVAASGGWLFRGHGHHIVGVTQVTVKGRSWRVTLTQLSHVNHANVSTLLVQASSGNLTLSPKKEGVGGFTPLQFLVRPFTAVRGPFVPGGQIWAGITRSTIRSVSITDYAGHVFTTNTIAAPRASKTPYRYWALAVSSEGLATFFTTHDVSGKTIRWRLTHA
jgi:hypothetical protein